jgi:hypothetical protein
MKSYVKIEWRGEEVKNAVLDACEEVVNDAAELVLKKAQDRCPVETVESVARRTGKNGTGNYRVRNYGAASGSLKKSGRIARFRKKGVVGAYITFGGKEVAGVDTYYGPFVELGTPGTTFQTKTGYWGHKIGEYYEGMIKKGKRKGSAYKRLLRKGGVRVAVEAKPFLRPSLKSSRARIRNSFKTRLGGK